MGDKYSPRESTPIVGVIVGIAATILCALAIAAIWVAEMVL